MSKAFTKEDDTEQNEAELDASASALPKGAKNYITPSGAQKLKTELAELLKVERPKLVNTISWAASNGDRSENGDYIYGKRRLREIDRRIRFLTKRLEASEIVDPAKQERSRVLFGATVTFEDESGSRRTVQIVGVDEIDAARGKVSWVSPVARALLGAKVGELVTLRSPRGEEELEILEIRYE